MCSVYENSFTVKNKPSVGWDALRTTKERLGRHDSPKFGNKVFYNKISRGFYRR